MKDLPYMHPTKFRFIWQSGFRGKYFLEINQSEKELPVPAMSSNGLGQNEQSWIKQYLLSKTYMVKYNINTKHERDSETRFPYINPLINIGGTGNS